MGLLHIYCGNGKGKTTASLGLALRASGADMKVCFVQFMKGGETSELNVLNMIPNITILRCNRNYGFYKNMTNKEKSDITDCHNRIISTAFECSFDMIILDEFNSAYSYGLIDKKLAENLILNSKKNAEIVLTGRNPADIFIQTADYISEINCKKHPFEKGITARKGIEF